MAPARRSLPSRLLGLFESTSLSAAALPLALLFSQESVRAVQPRPLESGATGISASAGGPGTGLVPGTADARERARRERLPGGTWGGESIGLEITETGAKLEFSCARGTIDEPILLDRDGGFEVKGTYVQEHGGPQREDEEPEARPALFGGHVKGKEMILEVRLPDTNEVIDTFTLFRGRAPRIRKCR